MNKLELIEQWAKDNGYDRCNSMSPNIWINFTKTYQRGENIWAYQRILVNSKTFAIDSVIDHRSCSRNRNNLEELYIPLNRVKRDEKNLKEFLNNPQKLIIYEDDDGEDEHGRSIIRRWGECPYCGAKLDTNATKCTKCDREILK